MKEVPNLLEAYLGSIPDHFEIMEVGVDLKTQAEYLEASMTLDIESFFNDNPEELRKTIFDKAETTEAKKKALILLGFLGSITAFRILEEYIKKPDPGLEKWTALSLQACKRDVESILLDENIGYIISGLGGIDNRLRFYLLLLPIGDKKFTDLEKKVINDEFSTVCTRLNCIAEKIETTDQYAAITALVPLDVAPGTLITSGIEQCNSLGEFVLEHYYATNLNIPEEKEIKDIIQIVLEGKLPDL